MNLTYCRHYSQKGVKFTQFSFNYRHFDHFSITSLCKDIKFNYICKRNAFMLINRIHF